MDKPADCQNCELPKTIHLTQVVGQKVKKVDLCEKCPHADKLSDPKGFELVSELLGQPPEIEEFSVDDDDETIPAMSCDQCGYTGEKLKKTGRLGCPDCYEAFAEVIQDTLKDMHRGLHHVGKIPASLAQQIEREKTLEQLQTELQAAIDEENYEEAAKIRDSIKALKTQAV